MSDFTMTIAGNSVPAGSTFGVINPATGQVFAQAPECSRAQLDAAMESASRAFRPWSRDLPARRKALLACAEALKARLGELAPILTQEQGQPLGQGPDPLVVGQGRLPPRFRLGDVEMVLDPLRKALRDAAGNLRRAPRAVAFWGPLALGPSAWLWRWKAAIDRRFMAGFTNLVADPRPGSRHRHPSGRHRF